MSFPMLKESREYFTDFVGGSPAIAAEPFFATIANTGLQTQVASVYPSNVGIQSLSAGTTSAAGAVSLTLDDGSFLVGAAPHHFRCVFQIPTLANTGVNDFSVIMGFYNTTTGIDGAWFSITTASLLQINYLDNNVGATAVNVTGAVAGGALVAGTWYEAIIDVNVPIINSNQAVSPNLGGPITGARFYFGPLVPVPQTTQAGFNSQGRYVAGVPKASLPGFSDTRTVGARVSVLGVTGTGASRLIWVDKVYVNDGLMGYV